MRRLVKLTGVLIGVLGIAALLIVAAAIVVEFEIPLGGNRDAIAGALSKALKVPVRIGGALTFRTGPRAGIEASEFRIGEDRIPLIDVERLSVRLDLARLWNRDVQVADALVEGLRICAGANLPEARGLGVASQDDPSWRFTGIERLRLERVLVASGEACAPDEASIELPQVDATALPGTPIRLSARVRFRGEDGTFELVAPSLDVMTGTSPGGPFRLVGEFAAARTELEGSFDVAGRTANGDIAFETPQLSSLTGTFGANMGEFGPLRMQARASVSGSELRLDVSEAALAPGSVTGQATLNWSRLRPSLDLEARTAKLDVAELRKWLERVVVPVPGDQPPVLVSALRASEGRIAVDIGQIVAGRHELSNLAVAGGWTAGVVKGTFHASHGRHPLSGTLDADVRSAEAKLDATVAARRIALPADLGIGGTIAGVEAKLRTRGTLDRSLAANLRGTVAIRTAKLVLPGGTGKPTALDLRNVLGEWGHRATLSVRATTEFAGEAVTFGVSGPDAAALWEGRPWVMQATAGTGPLRIETSGKLAFAGGVDADLSLRARADRLDRLARGNTALAGLPLEVEGTLGLNREKWRIALSRVRLGNTRARASAAGVLPVTSRPIRAEAAFDSIDLTELVAPRRAGEQPTELLPHGISLPPADLSIRAGKVALPRGVAESLTVDATVRNGKLAESPFSFRIDGAAIEGTLAADLTRGEVAVLLAARVRGITEKHFGEWPEREGVKLALGDLSLSASSAGNRVRDLVANASGELRLRQSTVEIAREAGRPAHSMRVHQLTVSVAAGQATRIDLAGETVDLPVSLAVTTAALPGLLPPADAPFRVNGRVAGIEIDAEGRVPGSSPGDYPLTVKLTAPTLSHLKPFTRFDLPSTGPLTLAVTLRDINAEHRSADLDIALGESRLAGKLARQVTDGRIRWEAAVTGPLLRLEDLGSAGWVRNAPTGENARSALERITEKGFRERLGRARLVDDDIRAALKRLNVHTHVSIARVSSGEYELGGLNAEAVLESSRIRATLGAVGESGARLDLAAKADYTTEERPFELDLQLEKLDYGRLLRSIDPSVKVAGRLSVRLDLAGSGRLGEILPRLKGRAGVIVFPGSTQGLKLLELWGGGLLGDLRRSLDPTSDARLNCGVATFEIDKGLLTSKALMLDSTHVRAAGELKVDLLEDKLDGLVAPRSKSPELFSTQTPVQISGTIAEPVVTPAVTGVAIAAASLYFVGYAFLFDAVTGGQLAADGSPDCIAAYEKLAPR